MTLPTPSPRDAEIINAIVMPHQGQSDDRVSGELRKLGGEVKQLATGFLSVQATRAALQTIAAIARIEEKPMKQLHYF